MTDSQPVVLVHGFWHGGWCWSRVTEQLAARGIQSVAVDLDGHGLRSPALRARWARPFDATAFATESSPVATVTASSAAAALADQVRTIGDGRPCLVVAHSMGGAVATALAELVPELVGGLVYVSAIAPVSGVPAGSYAAYPENAGEKLSRLLVADPAVVGAARVDFGDPASREQIKEAFCHDADDRTAAAAIALLSPDGPLGMLREELTVTAARYGSIPHTYVTCAQDNAIRLPLQHRFIEEIDAVSATPATVVELDTSHSPFYSQPAALTEASATAASRSAAQTAGV
ncbi:alpha/beta hydrolase [Amycolatopsis minnesotensis]|uniref:Alpha/beta fold hydrolase n=1 Tax=Amycolatopsis minnesotensis TaxID=337894 RepID=A0ABN2SMI9_9PSEU